jgi:hypothetical protein
MDDESECISYEVLFRHDAVGMTWGKMPTMLWLWLSTMALAACCTNP